MLTVSESSKKGEVKDSGVFLDHEAVISAKVPTGWSVDYPGKINGMNTPNPTFTSSVPSSKFVHIC